jgi:hypothetical protein
LSYVLLNEEWNETIGLVELVADFS